MVVEVFNDRADGRVFSGACVTSVSGGPDTGIVPECPGARTGGKEVTWGQEDDIRVEQLRSMRTGETSEPRQLEEITGVPVTRDGARDGGVHVSWASGHQTGGWDRVQPDECRVQGPRHRNHGESVADQKISSNLNNSDDTKSAKINPEERGSIKRPRSVTPLPP